MLTEAVDVVLLVALVGLGVIGWAVWQADVRKERTATDEAWARGREIVKRRA